MSRIIRSGDAGYADLCAAQADVAPYDNAYWRRVSDNGVITFAEIIRVPERDSFGQGISNAFAPYAPVIKELSDEE